MPLIRCLLLALIYAAADSQQIAAGDGFSCVLRSDFRAICVGGPVPPFEQFQQLVASGTFVCGLTLSGQIVCFGSTPPVTQPSGTFDYISASGLTVCGIHSDSKIVQCWVALPSCTSSH